MSDHITATARRVMAALNQTTLNKDPGLHFDVWTLAQEWLAPSAMVPPPEELDGGIYRWTGPSGWKVTLNRFGDVYVSDARIPADERAIVVDVIRAAHAFARHLPAPDLDDEQAEGAR